MVIHNKIYELIKVDLTALVLNCTTMAPLDTGPLSNARLKLSGSLNLLVNLTANWLHLFHKNVFNIHQLLSHQPKYVRFVASF
jgi:hypothetical protein